MSAQISITALLLSLRLPNIKVSGRGYTVIAGGLCSGASPPLCKRKHNQCAKLGFFPTDPGDSGP